MRGKEASERMEKRYSLQNKQHSTDNLLEYCNMHIVSILTMSTCCKVSILKGEINDTQVSVI